MRKIFIIALIFITLLLVGTFGYMLTEGMSFWMGMYLTIITVFLVITSVSFVMYTFSKGTETMIEGELRGLYKRRKMNRQISRLRDHYIVCGFGRIGKEICKILQEHQRP